jgi:hypothetical protein
MKIKSKHTVNGKTVLYLEEKQQKYKPMKKSIKAKKYFSKIKNSK